MTGDSRDDPMRRAAPRPAGPTAVLRPPPEPHPDASDAELLRRYAPILRFTHGEHFAPIAVEDYLAECSLWVAYPSVGSQLLLAQGDVTMATLTQPRLADSGAVFYLRYIEPLNIADVTAYLVEQGVQRFRASPRRFRPGLSRLARVGYGARLVDALFSLSLLARGRVPGETAAAAILASEQRATRQGASPTPCYGRVKRDGRWIALQYWYLYAFNDWRFSFHGVNDHECDWEMITVYLYRTGDGRLAPRWVAMANHDSAGDDLRRRWDDIGQLELDGDHPVAYVAAGSHAAYFLPGEYLSEYPLPVPTGVQRVATALERLWTDVLRQPTADRRFFQFRIPFVDYARGDGVTLGDAARPWTLAVISEETPWVSQYRGLWGVYVRDVFAGENAPAGPMYNRDGSVRHSWRDPVGWAGLDKVPTPAEEGQELARARAVVEARQQELRQAIAAADDTVQHLGATLRAIVGHPHLRARAAEIAQTIAATSAEAARQRHERATNDAVLQAMDLRAARLKAGVTDDPRSHIRKLVLPATEPDLRLARLVEIWGAVSISLLAVLVVALVIVDRDLAAVGAPALLGAFIVIEAIFRRQVARLIEIVTVSLAIVAAGVLVTQLFWQLVVALIVLAAVFVVWENVQELRG